MNNEEWYDNEIAPALAELAKRCNERGMAFVAVIEYAPGDRGGTYYLTDQASLPMHMLNLCARTAPNVDAYVINLRRHCVEQGIDTSSSMVMRGDGIKRWISNDMPCDAAKETDLWRCTACGRTGTVGRCCGEETREPVQAHNA